MALVELEKAGILKFLISQVCKICGIFWLAAILHDVILWMELLEEPDANVSFIHLFFPISNARMLMDFIFVLGSQGISLLSCMETPLWKLVLRVD